MRTPPARSSAFAILLGWSIVCHTSSGSEYVYLGCFQDNTTNRVLSGSRIYFEELTTEACAEICAFSGDYQYFGTEFSLECYCGISTDQYGKLGGNMICDSECGGNATEFCGGFETISIYNYTVFPTAPETEYEYLGCFEDTITDRVLTGARIDEEGLTTEICATICATLGHFPYFGTENGFECYCGLSTDEYDELGFSDRCASTCGGLEADTCGGFEAISVYNYTVSPIGDSLGTITPTPVSDPIIATLAPILADASSNGNEGNGSNGNSIVSDVFITIIAGLALMGVTWLLKQLGCFCEESPQEDEEPPRLRLRRKWTFRSTNSTAGDLPDPVVRPSRTVSL